MSNTNESNIENDFYKKSDHNFDEYLQSDDEELSNL